jgi:hypothetical protein
VVEQVRDGGGALHGPAVADSVWGWGEDGALERCYACYAAVTVGVTPETNCATADLLYLVTLLHL